MKKKTVRKKTSRGSCSVSSTKRLTGQQLFNLGWHWSGNYHLDYFGDEYVHGGTWTACQEIDHIKKVVRVYSDLFRLGRRRPVGWVLSVEFLGLTCDYNMTMKGSCKSVIDAVRQAHVIDVSEIVEKLRKRKYNRKSANSVYIFRNDEWIPFATVFSGSDHKVLAQRDWYGTYYPGKLVILEGEREYYTARDGKQVRDSRFVIDPAFGGYTGHWGKIDTEPDVMSLPDWCHK
jgi:hypothetical protein